jgi:hypothetical protein
MAPAPSPTQDLFISYHSGDADWVTTLAADLKALGVSVWLDREQLRPGDLFVKALEDALASVRCVLVVVSSGSLRSFVPESRGGPPDAPPSGDNPMTAPDHDAVTRPSPKAMKW